MLKAIREGSIDINFSFDAAAVAGKVAMLDATEAGAAKVSDGTAAYGFISQSNANFADGQVRSVINPVPNYGDKIGLYVEGGEYVTDQIVAADYAPGETLYVTTDGLLVNATDDDASATAGVIAVGTVIQVVTGGVHFRSLL